MKIKLLIFSALFLSLLTLLNQLSYGVLKRRILRRQRWDLNVCCGKTDGGGINADILRRRDVPKLVLVDVYHLPFRDGQFPAVLSSHTIEHVENPDGFYAELERVGQEVTLVIPPLWDLSAAFNLLEHRSIFLSLRKQHKRLPAHVRLPLARSMQALFGQRIHA